MKSVIAICGATASGKSEIALALSKRFNCEIISADAFQLYRGMDIGTAKVSASAKQEVTHHLLDILDPQDAFSVQEYQRLARGVIEDIHKRKKTPLIVGGSGLYLQALLYDYRFEGEKRRGDDDEISITNSELHQRLKASDPQLAASIHPNNRRRLLRALELIPFANANNENTAHVPFYDNLILIGLALDRKALYERIENRVDKMIESGLVEEVRKLKASGLGKQASQAIGYKEIIGFLDQTLTLAEAIQQIKLHTRRYAKRQLTWFNNQMQPKWFTIDSNDTSEITEAIIDYIKEKTAP
ncbi:MAG: tRNA (adenosine(37)-N6)-dimethylallyltransferase MiaA [Candidatus Izemoplasmatales bacterium]|jgi:tRNA dimethylallyltransferase